MQVMMVAQDRVVAVVSGYILKVESNGSSWWNGGGMRVQSF